MNKVKETGKYKDQKYKEQKVGAWAKVWALRRNVVHSETTRVIKDEFRKDLKLHTELFYSDSKVDPLKSLDVIQF